MLGQNPGVHPPPPFAFPGGRGLAFIKSFRYTNFSRSPAATIWYASDARYARYATRNDPSSGRTRNASYASFPRWTGCASGCASGNARLAFPITWRSPAKFSISSSSRWIPTSARIPTHAYPTRTATRTTGRG